MLRSLSYALATGLVLIASNFVLAQETQTVDSHNPHYKKAQQLLDNNKPVDAAAEYEAALGANPKQAGLQYELGLLYAEKLQDPVSSIFHLKRFIELAPDSDHAAKARDLIDKEGRAFAASLPNSASQNGDELAKLLAENAVLKKQVDDASHTIAQLQGHLAGVGKNEAIPLESTTPDAAVPEGIDNGKQTTGSSTNAATAGPLKALPLDATNANSTAAAPPDLTNAKSYTVVKGDSLWKIAHKMYPHDTKNGVDKIQEANKDAIGGKPLKIGQVLLIPQ